MKAGLPGLIFGAFKCWGSPAFLEVSLEVPVGGQGGTALLSSINSSHTSLGSQIS